MKIYLSRIFFGSDPQITYPWSIGRTTFRAQNNYCKHFNLSSNFFFKEIFLYIFLINCMYYLHFWNYPYFLPHNFDLEVFFFMNFRPSLRWLWISGLVLEIPFSPLLTRPIKQSGGNQTLQYQNTSKQSSWLSND